MIPLQRLYRVNVVVNDLRVTTRNYAEILGVNPWRVAHHGAGRVSETSAFGFAANYTYSSATGSSKNGVTFRLIQPADGFSTFTEFLITRGEGVHSICATQLADLAEIDLTVGQAETLDGRIRHVYFDTRDALGGFFMEVTSGEDTADADETWDFSHEVQSPPGVRVLQHVRGIGHFGVAVPDLMRKLPAYAQLVGLEIWNGVHFHPGTGSLEYSTFNGERVEHAFMLAIAGQEDVTFELLQSISGPTDYATFLQKTGGPGIHHMLLLRDLPESDWLPLRASMELVNVPVIMSGRVRSGAAEFYYLDTRAKLGGWVLEVIVARPELAGAIGQSGTRRFTLDFSRRR